MYAKMTIFSGVLKMSILFDCHINRNSFCIVQKGQHSMCIIQKGAVQYVYHSKGGSTLGIILKGTLSYSKGHTMGIILKGTLWVSY